MQLTFCNFLGTTEFSKTRCKVGSIRLNSPKANEQIYKVDTYMNNEETEIILSGKELDKNLYKPFNTLGVIDEELQATEENPLIMVATKNVRCAIGVPTHLKYVVTDEGILVILMSGSIQVFDGENYIALNRNLSEEENCMNIKYSVDTISSLNMFRDFETGIYYEKYLVNDLLVKIAYDRGDSLKKNTKLSFENSVFLDKDIFDREKRILDAKKKEQEDLKLKKKAENDEYTKKKAEQELKDELESKSVVPREKVKKAEKKKSDIGPSNSSNSGALAFLNAVASHRG